ncbi:hypothetical protein BH10BAC3_BH10BAC3_33920 [soil metagenome]
MLTLCLEKLAAGAQTLDNSLYEVIVTDDGRHNEAKQLIEIKYPWASWMEGPKKGPAANRNNGAKKATGKWLVFTDDDCLPDPDWLHAYKKGLEANLDCKAFEGAILPDDWELLKKDMAECPVNTKGGAFWSANIMVEKNLFWQVDGFDEKFKIAAQEDQDLQKKILVKTNIKFWSDARIIHPVRIAQFKQAIKNIPRAIQNWYQFNRKYNNMVSSIRMGTKSQVFALASNVLKARIKSATVNCITLVCLLPVMFFYAFKKIK